MKTKLLVVIALLLVTILSLSSCRLVIGVVDFVQDIINPKIELTDAPLEAEKIIDFANGANPDVLFESDGWSNGDVFNVVWKKHNVFYGDGIMRLGITEEKATAWIDDAEVEYSYTAGEARTQNYYHYGDYEVSMKPSANPGTASTFFTCTGPYDTKFVLDENGEYLLDENGQRLTVANPHDEIDIEFLGKDTTHVQFNFFVDGKGGNEYMHELGFDASEDFHTYGYRWTETSITWFVDGVPVYKVTTDSSVEEAANLRIVEKIPQTPGRMLTNYWCGNDRAVGWMGRYNGNSEDQGTEYQWMATSAQGAPLNPPEKPSEEIEGIDWSAIDAIAPGFASTELYTVTTEGTSSNITYTAVGGSDYKNVEMDITEAAADKNYLHLVVKNNGENPVRFRVNVIDRALIEAGAQNMSTNQSATVNGEVAYTDLVWGGSFFDLAAGETYEIVICFNGQVELLQLMPDSSKNDSSVNAGDITVSEIKFAKLGEIEIPEDPNDPPVDPPVTPPVEDDGLQLEFWVSDGSLYQATGNNIKYNGLGNSYACAGSNVASHAAGHDTFIVTITNNGAADSRVRIDIQGTTQVGNHTVLNTAATGGDVWTDMEWGGSAVTVPAGQSVTLVITYDENTDRGAVTNLVVFADSARGTGDTYSADITLSGMAFSGGEGPVEPPVNPPVEDNSYDITFGEETVAVGNPDKWYFWNDQNWCGSNVTAGAARYDEAADKATFTYSGATSACWFGYQAFYKQAANELGKTYKLTCTIISESAGDITINGQVVTLVAGENSIELTVTEGAGASFALQCGNAAASSVIAANTFSICDLTFTAVEGGNEGGEGDDPVTPPSDSYTIVFADENNTVADPGVWHFWNDQNWCGSNVTAGAAGYDAAADKATFTYSGATSACWFGYQVFYKHAANEVGKTYTLTCTITSEVAGDITINGQVVTLVAGENNINLTIVQSAAASFSLQCGNEGAGTVIAANTFSISGLTFTAVESGNPVTPPAEGEYLSYNANDCYVLSATPDQYVNTLTVSYTAAYRDTYLNVNTYVLDKAAGKSTMFMSIKNESNKTVTITVKLEGEGGQSEVKLEKTVEIAAGDTLNLSEAYGDGAKMLYFFIDTGWSGGTITEAQSGTVVISGVSFQ